MAGRTRKDIEQQSGQPVISTATFKQLKAGAAKTTKRLEKADE